MPPAARDLRRDAALLSLGLALTLTLTLALPAAAQSIQLKLSGELPSVMPCPEGLPALTECRRGRDHLGAWVWMARPADWNGKLVVHAHGGPELGDPSAERSARDLQRWSVWLRAGWAWVGSSFRQGGVELRAAADDTERARQAFVGEYGEPAFTLLHGQSWGAGVAASVAERFTTPDFHPRRPMSGRPPYSAVLLSSGVLGGGTRAYDVRLDLRVVYQAVCRNHPRPDEPGYPLWMGYPLIAGKVQPMTRAQLAERVDECTGLSRPAAQRSAAQQRALDTISRVTTIPESALLGHLAWATWHFHDIVWRKLKGANPFGNEGVVYRGSGDARIDQALNARVDRYRADPAALAALAADTHPSGRIHRPVLTLHAVRDTVAFVELESQWRQTMEEAGSTANLLQVYSDHGEHSYLSDAAYLAAAKALEDWVRSSTRPNAADVAAGCRALDPQWQPATGCRFLPDYQPKPLDERVPPRRRGQMADLPAPADASAPALPAAAPNAALNAAANADPREPRLPPAPQPISPLTR